MKSSIVLIRTYNFSARVIHLGMLLFQLLRFRRPNKCYNHGEVRFGKRTSGSTKDGTRITHWFSYILSLERFEKVEYPLDLTSNEIRYGEMYLYESELTKYEFEMFWYHFLRLFTGKWYGSKSDEKLFCYEHIIRYLNATGKYSLDPFMNPIEFKNWADSHLK